MRGQRSKQYRKLMQQYGFAFGFREPYQVLIDVGMLEASVVQFKMDLLKILTRTLHGEVKPSKHTRTCFQYLCVARASCNKPVVAGFRADKGHGRFHLADLDRLSYHVELQLLY